MSRNLASMLDYEAKRRPEITALVARIDQMSEAEIAAAAVPLPWMRQALLALKREHAIGLLSASLADFVVDGHVPDPMGEMRRWEGPDSFVKVDRTQIEVRYGQTLWIDQSGMWIDTIHTKVIDPMIARYTVSCGRVSRLAYIEAVRSRARQLCPSTTASQPLDRVRIYRPA